MVMREVKHITSNTPQDKRNDDPIWSKDGKYIVYTQEQAKGTDSNIFIADVATGKSTLLTPHEGEQRYFANDLSPDGKQVLLTSNAETWLREHRTARRLATRKITWLSKEKWEIRGGEFSPDGKRLTFSADVDGNQDIYVHDLGTGKSTALAIAKGVNEPSGGHSAFSADGSRLLYVHNGPTRSKRSLGIPHCYWKVAANHAFPRWQACVPRIWLSHSWSTIRAATASGAISAFLYVPFNMARNGQNAAIVYIHGGPTSQSRNSFNRFVQFAVNQGYMVLAPNYRGSTGYGKEFRAGESVRHGRRRPAGCAGRRRLDQADGPSRSEKDCGDGRRATVDISP